MSTKIGEIECLFCDDLISFYDGETGIYQSHLESKHEVDTAKKELFIAFCFLREKELQELLNKVQPRKEYFLEHGEEEIDEDNDEELDEELDEKPMNCDIYKDMGIVEPTEQIEQKLQLYNAASDNRVEEIITSFNNYSEDMLVQDDLNKDNTTAEIVTKQSQTRNEQIGRKYSCNQCESTYSAQQSLRRHQASVHEGKIYSCDQCEYSAPRGQLSRHINTIHGSVTHLCEVCDYQTRDKRCLKTHQLKHTGERPYLCTSCPKAFSRSGSLIIHQLTHTKDKSFKCPTCTKSFAQSGHLKEHQLVHTSKKCFTCEICAKEFYQPRSLRRHQLVHNSVKCFQCEECDYSCNRSSSFAEHMNKHKMIIAKSEFWYPQMTTNVNNFLQ